MRIRILHARGGCDVCLARSYRPVPPGAETRGRRHGAGVAGGTDRAATAPGGYQTDPRGRFGQRPARTIRVRTPILARMNHPAIAKVFDAGTTADGTPYFVMEYVSGIPLTVYCDQKRLSIRQRLELFLKVCEGVQHAH